MAQLLLASFLEGQGFKASIYQERAYSVPKILEIIKKNNITVVGITCFCANFKSCTTLADLIKKFNKDIYVILGGVHATLYHREIMEKFPQIDIVVRGEGEETLAEIMAKLSELNTGIQGITFRKDGEVLSSADRVSVLKPDRMPDLSYHLLGKDVTSFDYTDKWWPLHTGRGSSYNCAFCASGRFWKRSYRVKGIGRIIKEIHRCMKEYRVRKFMFDDLVFSVDRKRVLLLCEEFRRANLNIEWCCKTRIDCLDQELLRVMRDAGCRRIIFAVDSFSDKILKLMNHNYKAAQALEILNFALGLGIEVKCQFVLGFPGENDKTLKETMSYIYRLREGASFNAKLFHVYSGTDIYDKIRDKGLINDKQWIDGYDIDDFTSTYYSPRFLKKLKIAEKLINQRSTSLT